MNVTVLDQLGEVTEEGGEQQDLNMRAINIGIRQYADTSLAQAG